MSRARTVVPAVVVVLLLVLGTLGAALSFIGGTDGASSSPPVPTPAQVPPAQIYGLATAAIAGLVQGERFHVEMATAPANPGSGDMTATKATISGEIDLSSGPDDPERIATDIAIEFGEGAALEVSQIKIGSKTWIKPAGADKYERSRDGKEEGGATAAEVDPIGPLLRAMQQLPRTAFTASPLPADPGVQLISVASPPRGSGTRWKSLTLAVDPTNGQAKGLILTKGKMNAVASFSRIGDPSISIEPPTKD